MNLKEIGDRYIHLTNVAVQKTAANYNKQQVCRPRARLLLKVQPDLTHGMAECILGRGWLLRNQRHAVPTLT